MVKLLFLSYVKFFERLTGYYMNNFNYLSMKGQRNGNSIKIEFEIKKTKDFFMK